MLAAICKWGSNAKGKSENFDDDDLLTINKKGKALLGKTLMIKTARGFAPFILG